MELRGRARPHRSTTRECGVAGRVHDDGRGRRAATRAREYQASSEELRTVAESTHQNQIGFLYASAPFAPGDFTSEREQQTGPARDRVCLGSDSTGHDPAELYMLECFDVIARLSPQLIEVGAAPD